MQHPLHGHARHHVAAGTAASRSTRILEPIERLSEVLFGLIMVLTFTGSLSVAEVGREDVRTMLIAALGCNLAWGIIDGVLYLLGALAERSSGLATVRAVREASTVADAHRHIADVLPSEIAVALGREELESIRGRLLALPAPPARAHLSATDARGALGVLLLVFLSTLPVALPFMFMHEPRAALRVSNAIAIALLYVAGHVYGRLTGRSPVWVGVAMVALGVVLVGLTMALGG
jgi:VIT1/CCC1 family predicted Fe2+/Mn2+ transporter